MVMINELIILKDGNFRLFCLSILFCCCDLIGVGVSE